MLVRSLLVLAVCLVVSQLLSALPLDHDQDTLLNQENDQLTLEPSNDVAVVREKRTVGFLRQLFPTVSQIIDRKIQAITRILFRLIGRLVLRGGGGGGGGDDSSDDSDRRVQITLPSFPPSADDEDEEDEDSTGADSDDTNTTTTEPSLDENSVAESNVVPVVARKRRQAAAPASDAAKEEEYEDDDQAGAATGDNEVASEGEEDADDAESAESETNEDRNKRFLSLGGSGGSGGSGGGSGNFLFDIIRLVAGSGTTQNQDEADNAPLDENSTHSGKDDDGYSAGVPGPLTRLFVIGNRGIANLIQDLILRIAQTTERIVNFKARLITSII